MAGRLDYLPAIGLPVFLLIDRQPSLKIRRVMESA